MSPLVPASRLLSDPFFARLKSHLIEATGLAYYCDKDQDLVRHIEERLGKLGLSDCCSYLLLLTDTLRGPTELDILIEDLTIGETYFFRHREMFDALRAVVLPDVIARKQHQRQLRIWSAGCSIGAEAYSISLLFKRDLAPQLKHWETEVVGTDINRDFLARAREGRFEEWAFRATPSEVKASCFVPTGKSWTIAPTYRDGVSFQYHNLVAHPFPSLLNNLAAFDVILCRNVTIYFSLPIVRRLIEQFHQSLLPGGWLLVGHAEPNLDLFRSFRTINAPGAVLYQRRDAAEGKLASVAHEPPALTSLPVPWQPLPLPTTPLSWPSEAVAEAWPLPPPPSPTADVETIRSLADRGEWEQAAELCQQTLSRDSLTPVVYFYQALVLEQMGKHAEAEQSLRRILYLDRSSVLGHYYLGLLLQKKGQLRQAQRSFRNALELLERTDDAHIYVEGDSISASELKKLTRMHLEVLQGHE